MIELRPYQQAAVDEIREAFKRHRGVLLQLPTGAGKTICFSFMAKSSVDKGKKVLVLSNRTEILMQNGGALQRVGLNVEYVSPKQRNIPQSNMIVAMSQTLQRRLQKEEWREWLKSVDFLISDEAHCCTHDFIYPYLSDKCFRLLVTATPQRQGHQKQLGELAGAMVIGVSVKELISLGYLTKARHFSVAAPKLDDVQIDSGTKEYNQKSLAKKFEDKTLYKGVIDEWFRICPERKTIVFCVSSQQAIDFTKELVERGVSAKYVLSGKFDDDSAYSGERSDVMDGFKRGEFQVLVNVGVAVAGTDIPDVDCIVANYATTSMTKWRQSCGRGSRICEGKKDFIILDAGGNIQRLGFFEQEMCWSLWHDVSAGGGIQQIKECPTDKIDINHHKGCGAFVPTTCKFCPACGYKFTTEKDEIQLHLEEVAESEEQDLSSWAAQKKLEGWKLSRILVQCCLSNVGNEKKAFVEVYTTLYPEKGVQGANKYWFVWKKNVWDKIKSRKGAQSDEKSLPL